MRKSLRRFIDPAAAVLRNPEKMRRLGYRLQALSLLPPLVGFACFYLFAFVPQMREIYAGIIETSDIGRGILGLVLIIVLGAMLYVWHVRMSTRAIDLIYPLHADPGFDHVLFHWRDWKGVVCAVLPLLGLASGLALFSAQAFNTGAVLDTVLKRLPDAASDAVLAAAAGTRDKLTNAPLWGVLIVASVIVLLGITRKFFPKEWRSNVVYSAIVWTGTAAAIAVVVLPLLFPSFVVPVTRLVGPLAGATLVLISVVALLTWISLWFGSADRTLLRGAVAAALVLAAAVGAVLSLLPDRATRQALRAQDAARIDTEPLEKAFLAWLNSRADKTAFASRNRRYPVLIMAAQGGGIYATSSASAFLADLQDSCSNFAQHVFAISGVSGGAIGTAMFAGLVNAAGTERQSPAPCRDEARATYREKARDIILEDHLSPVIAMIAPDFARKPLAWAMPPAHFDRSSMLERSFACSFDTAHMSGTERTSAWSRTCDTASKGSGLRIPQSGYWSPTGRVPAAVFGATWAEVGNRIAFAPPELSLRSIGDGTVLNFTDLPLEAGDLPHSLIEAAAISARFPGIVPPRRIQSTAPGRPVWNFVDGAYVDNSGATTAQELFSALSEIRQHNSLDIDLRLVLLTDAVPVFDFAKVKGSRWYEAVSPFTTLLSVRSQLSRRAVTRAIDTVTTLEDAPSTPAARRPQVRTDRRRDAVSQMSRKAADTHALVVDVEQQTLKLPLGWKISRQTNDIVQLMMGHAEWCPATPPPAPDAESAVDGLVEAIVQNSCVKWRLKELLKAQ